MDYRLNYSSFDNIVVDTPKHNWSLPMYILPDELANLISPIFILLEIIFVETEIINHYIDLSIKLIFQDISQKKSHLRFISFIIFHYWKIYFV